jgi:hypothetical protein
MAVVICLPIALGEGLKPDRVVCVKNEKARPGR